MHYYQFNIGDYSKDAKHLTLEEDAIYRRLIDLYYLDETPIPLELKIVSRKILARGKEDIISDVLTEFFDKSEKGYLHLRIEKDIAKYHSKSEKAKLSAKARWDKYANAMRSHNEGNANHEPLTTNHEPLTKDQKTICENSNEISTAISKQIKIPYQEIVNLYHTEMPSHPRIEKLDSTRKSYIKRLYLDVDDLGLPDITHWLNFFSYIKQSQFLTGQTQSHDRRPFIPNLEWLTKPKNYLKITEGHYHG